MILVAAFTTDHTKTINLNYKVIKFPPSLRNFAIDYSLAKVKEIRNQPSVFGW